MNRFFLHGDIPLPEDIERCKQRGDLDRARELCELWLARPVCEEQKQRIAVEKRILACLPGLYPLNRTQAVRQLMLHIPEMDGRRFDKLTDEGYIDWIFIDGERRFRADIISALRWADSPYTRRESDGLRVFALLDDTIAELQKNGSATRRITVKTSLKVTASLPDRTPLRVHLPLVKPTDMVFDIRLVSASENLKFTAPENAGQRTLYFEDSSDGSREFFAVYSYSCTAKYRRLEPAMVQNAQYDFDLAPQPPHIPDSALIRSLCSVIVGGETNTLIKAQRIYNYITRCVRYSVMRPYYTVNSLAEFTAANLKGDCGAQSLLFIALCRCAGIPARWESGCFVTPWGVGMHDWARFYIAPFGWLYADCSFGGSAYRNNSRLRNEFYFGNIDCFRLPTCTEFQHSFDPPKKFWRSDPTDNQRGEAETDRRPLFPADYSTDFEVVAFE